MNCPVCKDQQLVMSERIGVEIDYCPQCRGVWLDRGELDKIIENSRGTQRAQPVQEAQQPYYGGHSGGGHHGGHSGHGRGTGGYKREKSFIERLFD